ncbi:hypothetical protein MKX03_020463, partial [Papaver bracteatum]
MNISIEKPPREILVSTNTGSSITLVQCKPCEDCYEQNKSSPIGHLTFETLRFDLISGRPVKIPQFAIGCDNISEGFKDVYSNGIVGLGTNKLSLTSQLGAKIDSKFSYCLVFADIGSSKFKFS